MVGEGFLLRVSPIKGIMRFGKKVKLSPWFIGPFKVLRRVGKVVYELVLPPSLVGVHPVFYVSMLRKYHSDSSHVLDFSFVQLDKDLSYIEELVAIIDRQVRKSRSKNNASVKVQWWGQSVEEATWETEQDMRSHYPHLFTISDDPSSRSYEEASERVCLAEEKEYMEKEEKKEPTIQGIRIHP
ncbi:uncharacterized protein [Nicotiana sylvestris]|uniref:uncharacterized protein n=1 Tax=Nicotiana sylvestris TaxID=4096 RepID=UPI00388C41DE